MSIDMSHARPTSTPSPDNTLSAWDAMQVVLDAERATRNAAISREFYAQPAKPRTVADIEKDIDRYTAWQKLEPVIHCLPWLYDVQAKLEAAQAELAKAQGGAK